MKSNSRKVAMTAINLSLASAIFISQNTVLAEEDYANIQNSFNAEIKNLSSDYLQNKTLNQLLANKDIVIKTDNNDGQNKNLLLNNKVINQTLIENQEIKNKLLFDLNISEEDHSKYEFVGYADLPEGLKIIKEENQYRLLGTPKKSGHYNIYAVFKVYEEVNKKSFVLKEKVADLNITSEYQIEEEVNKVIATMPQKNDNNAMKAELSDKIAPIIIQNQNYINMASETLKAAVDKVVEQKIEKQSEDKEKISANISEDSKKNTENKKEEISSEQDSNTKTEIVSEEKANNVEIKEKNKKEKIEKTSENKSRDKKDEIVSEQKKQDSTVKQEQVSEEDEVKQPKLNLYVLSSENSEETSLENKDRKDKLRYKFKAVIPDKKTSEYHFNIVTSKDYEISNITVYIDDHNITDKIKINKSINSENQALNLAFRDDNEVNLLRGKTMTISYDTKLKSDSLLTKVHSIAQLKVIKANTTNTFESNKTIITYPNATKLVSKEVKEKTSNNTHNKTSKNIDLPKTGETTTSYVWAGIFMLLGVVLYAGQFIFLKRKKKK